MTLMVVGDTEPPMVAEVIPEQLGAGCTVRQHRPGDAGVRSTAASRAIVVTDPELTRAEVSIARLEPPRGPVTTVGQRRRELVERIGIWAFDRRMSAEIAAGRVSFLKTDASGVERARTNRIITPADPGPPGAWRGGR